MCEYCEKQKTLNSCNFCGDAKITIYKNDFQKDVGMLEVQGMAIPYLGLTHCISCHKSLGDHEGVLCKRCKEKINQKGKDTKTQCLGYELIEDEIDIDSIEELDEGFRGSNSFTDERIVRINELIKAVKQLNQEIKNIKGE